MLKYIEKDGGFRDACITIQQRPLSMFEDGLQNFLQLLQVFKVYHNYEWPSIVCLGCCPFLYCKTLLNVYACFKPQGKVEEQCSKIEDLRNNMFQGEIFVCSFDYLFSK